MKCANTVVGSCHIGAYTYTLRTVRCGKENCAKCPHGPYWYVEGPASHGGRFKRYIGKIQPKEVTNYQQRLNLSL